MHRRLLGAAAVALAATLAATVVGGCGGSDNPAVGGGGPQPTEASAPAGAAAATVELKGLAFHPDRVSITAGQAVEWHWDDGLVQHDVVFDGFRSKLQSGGTYRHAFAESGTFDFHCSVHPQMKGTVEVTAG